MITSFEAPPLNPRDATATPRVDCFTNAPDLTAYRALTHNVPLEEMNPVPAKIADWQPRQAARASARRPLAKQDPCPENLCNRILRRATLGPQTPYPEWAVPRVDQD